MKIRRIFLLLFAVWVFLCPPAYAFHWWTMLGEDTGSGSGSWAAWDESTEAGLQSSDIFVCFFEGGLAADETGQGGGLTGVDLVLTENGNVAATSGTPPKRHFDGTDDYFTLTETAVESLMLGGGTWTIILKCGGFENEAAHQGLLQLYSSVSNDQIFIQVLNNETISFEIYDGGVGVASYTTPAFTPTTGVIYIIAEYDGTTIRLGTTETTKPDTWADVTNQDVTVVGCNFSDFTTRRAVGFNGTTYKHGDFYYLVVSDKVLLSE